MKNERISGAFVLANYPALQESLPGYLHEDFQETSGTAAEAVEAFLNEASAEEIQQVREEWGRLRKQFAGRPLKELQAALVRLGIAWRPESEEELQGLDEILTRGKA
ncbi:MAG TPA: contact-dependent growth inhibition system immunity protein [Candidatus Acidoferrum sp.]|nr:contact-dependent growth inhibition system immunity protein [Candidatus Acidoferrum sp.]